MFNGNICVALMPKPEEGKKDGILRVEIPKAKKEERKKRIEIKQLKNIKNGKKD